VGCNNDLFGDCATLHGPAENWNRASGFRFMAASNTAYRVVVDTVGGVANAVLQFNATFRELPSGATPWTVDATERDALVLRGGTLELAADPALTSEGDTFQWLINDRPIAGATQPRLLLPEMNFSDAARYGLRVKRSAGTDELPGFHITVIEPCRESDALTPGPVFWWGTAARAAVLQTTSALGPEAEWTDLGPFPASTVPSLWVTGEESAGFLRARPGTDPP
jgi:hypothetical protein